MVLVVRKATEQTALALTSELAAYGERARWSGIYYRGEKIGFSVSQMTERPGGFKLQEDGQMLITLMGDSIASKLHTEVNVRTRDVLRGQGGHDRVGGHPGHVTMADATRAKHKLTRVVQMLMGLRRA